MGVWGDGYYTEYTFSIYKNNTELGIEKVSEIVGYFLRMKGILEYELYCTNEDGSYSGSSIWNNHSQAMKDLSLLVRDVIFKLECIGEDGMLNCHKYYENGEETICEAEITFPTYEKQRIRDLTKRFAKEGKI